mgnify:CR=1 FL=1
MRKRLVSTRGCIGCGSFCAVDGCSICEGRVLCNRCMKLAPLGVEIDTYE